MYSHQCKLLTLSEAHTVVQHKFKQRVQKQQPDFVTRQRQLWEAALPEEILSDASTDSESPSSQMTDSSSSHSSQSDSSTSNSSQPTRSQPNGSHSSNSQTGNSQGTAILHRSAGKQTGEFESQHIAEGKHAEGRKEEKEPQEEEGEEEESFKEGQETGLGLHLTLGGDQEEEEEDGPEIEADGEEEYAEEEDPAASAQMADVVEDSDSRGDISNKDEGEEDQQRFAATSEAAQQTLSAAHKKVLQHCDSSTLFEIDHHVGVHPKL